MKRMMIIVISAAIFLTGSTAYAAASVQKCQETMAKFKELGNVKELLAQSYGYAVLPTIGEGGMGVGGAIGLRQQLGYVTKTFELGHGHLALLKTRSSMEAVCSKHHND